MNKTLVIILAIALVAVGVVLFLPEEEPTVQDKLGEAGESLSEAAGLAKQALEEKAEELESDLEEAIEDAQASALAFADDLKSSAEEAALDMSRLHDDLKREFDEGGALNADGYNPSRAKTALEDIGLSKDAATRTADWLSELYRTPERAEAEISEFLEKLKTK